MKKKNLLLSFLLVICLASMPLGNPTFSMSAKKSAALYDNFVASFPDNINITSVYPSQF